ncbi:MAG: hypothetical protein WC545_03425 [Patescibacteria group bacterium]
MIIEEMPPINSRINLSTEKPADQEGDFALENYLQDYLDLKKGETEKIKLQAAENLAEDYRNQYEFLKDERLKDIKIAVIPDNLWIKGEQPSESHAEKSLILFKQSYYENQDKPDEIAWLTHELAHCQNFMAVGSEAIYEKNQQIFAFEDLGGEYSYPNNLVEQSAFTEQFKYLKQSGKNKEEIKELLKKYYHQEDFAFFERLLDKVF